MLTPADDYLLHQTPYPIDTVYTTDRNFYDRYFFNGYRRDGEVYFAFAMGQYQNMGVFDAAFSIVYQGRQKQVRASRRMGADRMDARVGPIRVEIVEPLRKVRVVIEPNEHGVSGDLLFEARSLPNEEPHFNRRGMMTMDYTRMTQHGSWSGTLTFEGTTFNLGDSTWWGSRDHSWGIRGVGGRDLRGAPPTAIPQFFWTWAPLNFDKICTLFTASELSDGTRWHQSGVILTPYPDATETECAIDHDLSFQKGTRWIDKATLTLTPHSGEPLEITVQPLYHFLMQGIGYGHPKWGHGMWVGEDVVGGDEYVTKEANPMENLHVQTVSLVRAGAHEGIGIFEHIIMGPHQRYGFREMLDPAR
ncbi:MAG: hypothetical protein IT303_09495 [Dehalococcoidia bacterium]|nr:hypothetical protein [Dehalococcoidia bacterium]